MNRSSWLVVSWMAALAMAGCGGGETPAPVCGNGAVEEGEQCDDGNTTAGDGCSATCTSEAAADCGDGVREGGEECDDGNTTPGDGCSDVCTIETPAPVCGDGVQEGGEECDDGNTTSGDGCSDVCTTETPPPVCGDGTLDAGEECDDGNTTPGDGCSATCTTETPPPVCGDGTVDAGEECDDGNTMPGDGCSATCTAEPAGSCTPDYDLACAATDNYGTTEPGATDTADAWSCAAWDESGPEYTYTFVAASTGMVTVSLSGMTVDLDVFVVADAGGTCSPAACIAYGDESATFAATAGTTYYIVVDGREGAEGSYSLTVTCGACGDGVLDPGEGCDDGNTMDGDGCSATCWDETLVCVPAATLDCGGSATHDTVAADATDVVDVYSCTSWDETGREVAYTFVAPTTGTATVELTGLSVDLDVFVVGGACSPGACLAYGNSQASFETTAGETYYLVVDGYNGVEGAYTVTLTCSEGICGNGAVEGAEQCDDGNPDSEDGCSAACLLETCGDGVLQAGLGETCDDGNTTDGDGCSATCQLVAGACVPDYTLACGGTDTWSTVSPGATDNVDTWACAAWDESGPEYAYAFTPATTGPVTVTLSGMTVDLDVFVIGAGACDQTGCTASGDTSVTFTATAGVTYYVVVDGRAGASGDYTVSVACEAWVCGDGVVQASEQCDDSNTTSEDGCSAACLIEACGDGVLQPGLGEACDDGNLIDGDGCSATCQLDPGVCVPDWTLACGGGDTWDTTASGSTDNVDAYTCAAGWDETGREYAYTFTAPTGGPVTATLSGMTVDLDVFVLGGGVCDEAGCVGSANDSVTFEATAGETYFILVDGYAGAEGAYSISLTCGVCGDGVVHGLEQCDDGNTTSEDGCSAACVLEVCGDGVVQVGLGETCDDGNTTSGDGCSALCATEPGVCVPDYTLACGGGDGWATTSGGSTDNVDTYACAAGWDESGREYAYTFTAVVDGTVTATLSDLTVDLDVFVLGGGACDQAGCIASGDDAATFTAVAGQTYFIVVDGFAGAEGSYTLTIDCAGGSCGDGVVQVGEQCDDGNTVSEDGCAACVLEYCGDGVLQAGLGEACDDGNATAGDGCSAACQLEVECLPDYTLLCAGSDGYNNGGTGSTDVIDLYSCSGWNESGPEYTYTFTAAAAGDVTATLSGMSADLDVFVLAAPADGSCDPTTCVAFGNTSATWTAVAGQTYYVVVDGYEGAVSDYSLAITCAGGGGATCAPDFSTTCGESDSWATTGAGSTDAVDAYSCTGWNESGREYTYEFSTATEQNVTVTLTPQAGVDLDVFVVSEPGTGCSGTNCLAFGDSSATFHAFAATTYYVVVDGYNGAEGTYSIQFTCAP